MRRLRVCPFLQLVSARSCTRTTPLRQLCISTTGQYLHRVPASCRTAYAPLGAVKQSFGLLLAFVAIVLAYTPFGRSDVPARSSAFVTLP